jgi:hypothetical protein
LFWRDFSFLSPTRSTPEKQRFSQECAIEHSSYYEQRYSRNDGNSSPTPLVPADQSSAEAASSQRDKPFPGSVYLGSLAAASLSVWTGCLRPDRVIGNRNRKKTNKNTKYNRDLLQLHRVVPVNFER